MNVKIYKRWSTADNKNGYIITHRVLLSETYSSDFNYSESSWLLTCFSTNPLNFNLFRHAPWQLSPVSSFPVSTFTCLSMGPIHFHLLLKINFHLFRNAPYQLSPVFSINFHLYFFANDQILKEKDWLWLSIFRIRTASRIVRVLKTRQLLQ